MKAKYENDTLIAKAKRDYELKKAAYDIEVQTKVLFEWVHWPIQNGFYQVPVL